VLHLPYEEVFTNEVQLFQLRRGLLSEEEAQLGSLLLSDIDQDGIIHQDKTQVDFN